MRYSTLCYVRASLGLTWYLLRRWCAVPQHADIRRCLSADQACTFLDELALRQALQRFGQAGGGA